MSKELKKNTLKIIDKIARTVYDSEENNLAYIDDDDPSTYRIEYKVGSLCRNELDELRKQCEVWEEIKKIATIRKQSLSPQIEYVVMQIPLNNRTKKLFEEVEADE